MIVAPGSTYSPPLVPSALQYRPTTAPFFGALTLPWTSALATLASLPSVPIWVKSGLDELADETRRQPSKSLSLKFTLEASGLTTHFPAGSETDVISV